MFLPLGPPKAISWVTDPGGKLRRFPGLLMAIVYPITGFTGSYFPGKDFYMADRFPYYA